MNMAYAAHAADKKLTQPISEDVELELQLLLLQW